MVGGANGWFWSVGRFVLISSEILFGGCCDCDLHPSFRELFFFFSLFPF